MLKTALSTVEWNIVETERKKIFVFDHHYQLINTFNAMLKKCHSTSDMTAIGKYLEYLKAYVLHFFKLEEDEMKTYKYPLFDAHKAEHELFKEQVRQHYLEYAIHGVSLRLFVKTVHWSREWLENHVCKTDQTMVVYLHGKSINSSKYFH